MAAVRGSKQHEMVVVPYRPLYRTVIFFVFLLFMAALSWLTYEYGMSQGIELKVAVVQERDEIRVQLEEARITIQSMRSEIADLKLGEEVDALATEDVRKTVESLQTRIAQLNEEILFYKGVMAPSVGEKGLRIERLKVQKTTVPDRFKYSLRLTQVVDKHEYVQGGVRINFKGLEGQSEKEFKLSDLDKTRQEAIRFRFKYFQNIDGELTLPQGFEPREVMIVAQPTGGNAQRLEKKFDWQLTGG
jgi:hypothetical protein